MFIIERRTAGVLAALAMTAAMVVLSNRGDPPDAIDAPTAANSQTPPATAAAIGASSIAFAEERETTQDKREIAESK